VILTFGRQGRSRMPHKGFFTQGLAILLRSSPSLRAIEERPGNFKIVDDGARRLGILSPRTIFKPGTPRV